MQVEILSCSNFHGPLVKLVSRRLRKAELRVQLPLCPPILKNSRMSSSGPGYSIKRETIVRYQSVCCSSFVFDWLGSSMAELWGRVPAGNIRRKRKGVFRRVMNGDMAAKTPAMRVRVPPEPPRFSMRT